LATLSH